MQPTYQPIEARIQGAQGLALIALVLTIVHMSDCAGQHEKLVRRQVKQECLRQDPP